MKIVGLTGGIATGKSLVAGYLRDLGVPVVDADALARAVVLPGTAGLRSIVQRVGREVLGPEGELDRAALGQQVFRDASLRRWLEELLHPPIEAEMLAQARRLEQSGAAWMVYDAALLVETGRHRQLAGLMVVSCTPAQQLERLMARDGQGEAAARARVAAQMPLEDKTRHATVVIDNSGTPEQTRRRTQAAWELVRRVCG